MFVCQLFADLRIKCIKRYCLNRPTSMLKLMELMTSTYVKEIEYLGIYVEKAFKGKNELYMNQLVIFFRYMCMCIPPISPVYCYMFCKPLKVKSMQISGTEATRTQIQPQNLKTGNN